MEVAFEFREAPCLIFGLAFLCAGILLSRWRSSNVVCRLKGLAWNRAAFCRGWFITGSTGSGKTISGLRQLLWQVFKNQPKFGGLCIDDKGTLHESLLEMARHFGREKDIVLLRVCEEETSSSHRLNLVADRSIPFGTFARCIVDTAVSLGNRREQSFFRSAAQINIGQALAALDVTDCEVSLKNVHTLLTDIEELRSLVGELEERPQGKELARHFQKYLEQPPEQLAGIMGSVGNYLHYFTTSSMAEVFCRDSTFSLSDVDQGKIICLALPQKFQTERRYVGTMLKQLFFLHALRRFDLNEKERATKNLLLFVADEAQHFLTASEDGLSDDGVVDVVREAGLAFIAATQSSTSLTPKLGVEHSRVLTLNLRNRMIFTAADEEDARASAEFLGKTWRYEYSDTSGPARSRTRHRKEAFRIEPHKLRELRNHECILVHAENGFRRSFLPPINPDGKVCSWFRWW